MKARFACQAAMLLGCLTGPVLAQDPASSPSPAATLAPVYKVGDTWTFSASDSGTNPGSTYIESVVSVTANQTTLNIPTKSGTATETDFNNQGDLIRDGHSSYDPAKGLLNFPLAVGKSWGVHYVRHWDTGWSQIVSADAEVESFENVRVSAGSFDAYKIVVHGLTKGKLGGSAARFDITYWYAPSAKRIVEYVNHWTSYLHLETYRYELVAYSLAP